MFFCLFSLISLSWCFEISRLRLVDYNKSLNQFLVRGAYPGAQIGEEIFFIEYEEWKQSMKLLIDYETKIKLEDMYILDISLLHNFGHDLKKVEKEVEYFKKNPSHGMVYHWEINGTYLNATDVSVEERNQLLANISSWDVDEVPYRIQFVHDLIHSPSSFSSKPLVIYWHCAGGVDRTGEMSGSYYMKYFNWNFEKSYAYDNKIKGRNIGSSEARMMNWYCYYLEKYEKKTSLDCDNWF